MTATPLLLFILSTSFFVAMTFASVVYAVLLKSHGFVPFKNSGPILHQRMNSVVRCIYVMGCTIGILMLCHVVCFVYENRTISFFTALCLIIGFALVTVHLYMTYRRWGEYRDNSYCIASDNIGVLLCSVFQVMFILITVLHIRGKWYSEKRNSTFLVVSMVLLVVIVTLRICTWLFSEDFSLSYGTLNLNSELHCSHL